MSTYRWLTLMLILLATDLLAPANAAQESHAVVIMYHRFGESKYPSTNTTLAQLDSHIEYLKSNNFSVLPLPDVVAALRDRKSLPPKTVAITIDDAYRSVVTQAWPRFKNAGFPFTLFVASEAVDQNYADIMTWDNVRALANDGVTIGAHSHTHPHLPAISADEVGTDIQKMKARFRTELGSVPTLYAYPYGEAGLEDIAAIRDAGFVAAFGQNSGPVYAEADPHLLPRFALNENYGAIDRFKLVVNTKPLRAVDINPNNPVLRTNPPAMSFRVVEPPATLARVSCFGPRGQSLPVSVERDMVRITSPLPFPMGRARVNCTLRDNGQWFWFGQEFLAGGRTEGVSVHPRYRN